MTALPTTPLVSIALALGALGGVAGGQYAGGEREPAPVARPAPSAQAAVVGESNLETHSPRHAVRRAPDGMFYVWATVNDHRIRFLVDTGASVVVLNAADAAAIGARAGAYNGRIQTAGGGTAMAWTRLDEVVVGEHRVHGLRAAVVRNGLGTSLLGANLLSRLGSVRIEGDRLELG